MKIAVVKEKASSMLEVLRDPQGPRSNFEIGGGGGGHHYCLNIGMGGGAQDTFSY